MAGVPAGEEKLTGLGGGGGAAPGGDKSRPLNTVSKTEMGGEG